MISYDLVLGSVKRDLDRARINRLANGEAPYTREEVEENHIQVNCNNLNMTRQTHDARSTYASGFLQNGLYFTAKTDMGARHKRDEYGQIVTKAANRPLLESIPYFENLRAKFGQLVLHGIAPSVWEREQVVLPRPIGVEDALIPSGTILGFENLPFFFLRRSFTAYELIDLTRRDHCDPGWNRPFVDRCLKWLTEQLTQLTGTDWPEGWSPEKWQEMEKEGGGLSYSDRVPKIDCFDIYAFQTGKGKEPDGWIRRIILDSWSNPAMAGSAAKTFKVEKKESMRNFEQNAEDFLYTSGRRAVAESWQQIISFQFADLSAVFPARYHAIRSMGWLLYAPCHLSNRLDGKIYEAGFEALLQYFKVKSADDAQRALKLELANLGIIDETITPVPAAERWQPDWNGIEFVSQINQGTIDAGAKAYSQQVNSMKDRTEKTKFQVMAEIQAANALVSVGLNQAYTYAVEEYREIFRRLIRPASTDPRARAFREYCLRRGVPEKILNSYEAWDIQTERMMGGGNQTMEMAIAQWLMEIKPQLDPEPQRIVLRKSIMAFSKDPALARTLVPEKPSVGTAAIAEATRVFTALLQQLPADMVEGTNPIEYIDGGLKLVAVKIQQANQSPQKMMAPPVLQATGAMLDNLKQHIAVIAQDKQEKGRVKQWENTIMQLSNELRAFQQRLEAMQKKAAQQQQQNGQGMDPAAMAKAKEIQLNGAIKRQNAQQNHQQKLQQKDQSHQLSMRQEMEQHQVDVAAKDLETASNIRNDRLRSMDEGTDEHND